jgi:16S rRNA (guanine966-N2)-methyltransferase
VIIGSGRLKGKSLSPLGKQPWLRPTSDKAREALMDILRPVLGGARVLELCAGTGAVGIEMLSNGAAHVTFVDSDAKSVRLIQANVRLLALEDGTTTILKEDAVAAAARVRGDEVDIVVADPPFESRLHERILETLAAQLREEADGCIIVMEHATRENLMTHYAGRLVHLVAYKEKRYGDITMTLFRAVVGLSAPERETCDQEEE